MDDPLLTIGAFARAVGLTTSALRHYDECGLLRPAEVDDATGYRYYTPDLAQRARVVARMREAGMPIEAMRTVLDGGPEEARRALERFRDDQAARTARTASVLGEVLSLIEVAPGGRGPARVEVRGRELAAALRQVRGAADNDPASALGAVLLDVAEASVDVVATNRYWMAIRTLPAETTGGEARVVLGRSSAEHVAEVLDGYDDVVLEIAEHRLTIGAEHFDGRGEPYPAHRILLAGMDPAVTRAVLPHRELVEAVEATGRSEVSVRLSDSGVEVRGADDEPGRVVRGVVTGPSVTLRLGSALLLRALASTLGPEVEWAVSAAERAVRLSSPYQPGFVALLMPLGGA